MTAGQLLAGPRYPRLETVAFDRLAGTVDDTPRSLLYLGRSDHPERGTRERWREHGPPLTLSVETFDGVVGDCYERDRYAGSGTYVDQPLRDRLVELAVERLDDPSNPLSVPDGTPAAGLCQQVEDLLSLMEFADLHSPESIRERLASEGLDRQAETVAAVASAFEAAREAVPGADDRTLRAERYRHVVTDGTVLAEHLPTVDAVVLGGFTLFSPLERRLVEEITDVWPTVALLPQVTDTDEPVGVDRGAERALRVYRELGFEREHVVSEPTPADDAVRGLYRPAGAVPEVDTGALEASLSLRQPETIPREVRFVARDIRQRIADGTPAEEIGVVLPDPDTYRDRLTETFEQYGIPATLAIERPFGDTAVGEVVTELATLGGEEPPLEAVTALLANPLVTRLDGTADVGAAREAIARVAERLASRRLAAAYDHLDDDLAVAVQALVAEATALAEEDVADLPDRVETLLEELGVDDAVEALPKTPRGRTERAALEHLERVLETLALTDRVADPDRADPLARLERALTGETLDASGGRETGHVLVCGLDEAAPRAFEHTYVLGLTAGGVPSNPERLAFTRPINEAHEDFEQADIQQGARHDLGLLLAGDASLTLTVPERDLGGDPYVEADLLTELRRVTGLEPEPVEPSELPPGTEEDVQRSLAERFAHDGVTDYEPAVAEAAAADALEDGRDQRLQRGVACAAARASPALTPYDGQLSPETVATLHGTDDREPYSASRLETYAACGFEYLASRVLDISEPEEIGLEPDARERGGFLHDVLERYYAGLQSRPGEPVAPRDDRGAREAHLLAIALDCLAERFDDDDAPSAFQRDWLVKVFAGLGDPERNPHYGDDAFGQPEEGLLVRFLDEEFETVGKTTARPSWLEPRVGEPYGDETVLQEEPVEIDTPAGPVPLAGKIDRIDTVPGTDPTQLVVRDYKIGGTPSESDTLGGLKFQLPLYALLAEGALDGVETVGGAYYQVKPPTSVNHQKGQIGSESHATWAGRDSADTPLLRWRTLAFDSHDAFRSFIDWEVPERLGQLADGIASGRYHPTVLDPGDAGCRYCGYSDTCDVRSHRRRAAIDWIDNNGDAYVPLAARAGDPADHLEVE
jgi:ATP-dependent helicase/nuclease subunit B